MSMKKTTNKKAGSRPRARVVWRNSRWESCGDDRLVERGGRYYYEGGCGECTTADLGGPWDTLAEAVRATDLGRVDEMTREARAPGLKAAEVAALLEGFYDDYEPAEEGEEGPDFLINGERWVWDGEQVRPAAE
jgi:hypothetical protein